MNSQAEGTSYAPSALSLQDFHSQASQADAASQADSDAGFLAFAGGAYQTQQGLATQASSPSLCQHLQILLCLSAAAHAIVMKLPAPCRQLCEDC